MPAESAILLVHPAKIDDDDDGQFVASGCVCDMPKELKDEFYKSLDEVYSSVKNIQESGLSEFSKGALHFEDWPNGLKPRVRDLVNLVLHQDWELASASWAKSGKSPLIFAFSKKCHHDSDPINAWKQRVLAKDEAISADQQAARLKKIECARKLEEAANGTDESAFSAAVDDAEGLGIDVQVARSKFRRLSVENKLAAAMDACDESTLTDAIADAAALGIDTSSAEAALHNLHRISVEKKLAAAIDASDDSTIIDAIADAAALGIDTSSAETALQSKVRLWEVVGGEQLLSEVGVSTLFVAVKKEARLDSERIAMKAVGEFFVGFRRNSQWVQLVQPDSDEELGFVQIFKPDSKEMWLRDGGLCTAAGAGMQAQRAIQASNVDNQPSNDLNETNETNETNENNETNKL